MQNFIKFFLWNRGLWATGGNGGEGERERMALFLIRKTTEEKMCIVCVATERGLGGHSGGQHKSIVDSKKLFCAECLHTLPCPLCTRCVMEEKLSSLKAA